MIYIDSVFTTTISGKSISNKIEIEIKSEISETECRSWDFSELTFIKK